MIQLWEQSAWIRGWCLRRRGRRNSNCNSSRRISFRGWKLKDSEDILSTDAKYIFTISENVELIGVFEKDEEPEQVITAEEIVRQIVADKSFATSVKKGTKKLTLPGVPENAQIEISSVNPEGIIALNGEVTAPKADTEVIVTVKVTGTDGSVSYGRLQGYGRRKW